MDRRWLSGFWAPETGSNTGRFDQPAFLYNDDISVSTTGGTPPTISATRRPDNSEPEVLEVFIDGRLPLGQTTTFTFDSGTGTQAIAYYRERPEIPATSLWGLGVLTLAALILGAAMFRPRLSAPV